MNDENTYTDQNGVEYRAEDYKTCRDCAFDYKILVERGDACEASPPCTADDRQDGREIMWELANG